MSSLGPANDVAGSLCKTWDSQTQKRTFCNVFIPRTLGIQSSLKQAHITSRNKADMPVTTRRRAAILAAERRSILKTPSSTPRRNSQTPPPPIKTQEPKRHRNGKVKGEPRRRRSLPAETLTDVVACKQGHRLYSGEAFMRGGVATISPRLKSMLEAGPSQQARFYERKLAQVSADLAATGDQGLWKVHHVVDIAMLMLRQMYSKG